MKPFTPTKEFTEFLEKAVVEGKQILNLQDYRVRFEYVEKIPGYRHSNASQECTCECEIDLVYIEIVISVTQKAFKKYQSGERRFLREDILHELAHSILWPMTDDVEDKYITGRDDDKFVNYDENITQKISNIASKLLRDTL